MISCKKLLHKILTLILILSSSNSILLAQDYEANWKSLDSRTIPKWYSYDKFGIFIHWGVYSVPAWAPSVLKPGEKIDLSFSEWYWHHLTVGNKYFTDHHEKTYGSRVKYQDFAPQFKADQFNPEQWADIFARSGAKYVVLTSKHHDGFTLWPSKFSPNWNSVDIGPHKNLCQELSTAVKAKGLKMGFYYSLYEWFNPILRSDSTAYVANYMMPQLKELINTFSPSLLFVDGEWDFTSKLWQSESFLAWLYNNAAVKNEIVVNDRWGSETRAKHGGYYSTEFSKSLTDYKSNSMLKLWEECRGIGKSFGYNRSENIDDYQSSDSLITSLIEIVSYGGNLLLNVGPTSDGRIPVIMQQRLVDIGDWLKINGEAIYGTNIWDREKQTVNRKKDSSLFFTTKGRDIYVCCTKWPQNPLEIYGVTKFKKVSMLGYNKPLEAKLKNGRLNVLMPSLSSAKTLSKSAWVLKIEQGE